MTRLGINALLCSFVMAEKVKWENVSLSSTRASGGFPLGLIYEQFNKRLMPNSSVGAPAGVEFGPTLREHGKEEHDLHDRRHAAGLLVH
jgi:hypothetical protein